MTKTLEFLHDCVFNEGDCHHQRCHEVPIDKDLSCLTEQVQRLGAANDSLREDFVLCQPLNPLRTEFATTSVTCLEGSQESLMR